MLPSHTEGFPNVVLEAMAVGRPIIATDVGAIAEMLAVGTSEACGCCIPSRDVPALQSAIGRILADPETWEEAGRRARDRARRMYSCDVVVPVLISVLREVSRPKQAERHPGRPEDQLETR